jgi:hypothetical protein
MRPKRRSTVRAAIDPTATRSIPATADVSVLETCDAQHSSRDRLVALVALAPLAVLAATYKFDYVTKRSDSYRNHLGHMDNES